MQYPLQSDEYDVDIFNENFRELDGKIDENFETMSNNMAQKADVSDVEEMENDLNTKINGKASSSHNHSAGNITSGVLPVARGGTGQGSVDTTPTSGSSKMVTSGGVYEAINASGMASNVHRLKVTVDDNLGSGGSQAIIFNTVEKLSGSAKYETGDIVFVTFIIETPITENTTYHISLYDNVFGGKFGSMPLYYISHTGTSGNLTVGMLPKVTGNVFTMIFTLTCVSANRFSLSTYL